uniref:Uncharacterized protein n=1 Tax=Meloidogyne hapla TaxID=6305 RepID=A0A1I8BJE8_MELHA
MIGLGSMFGHLNHYNYDDNEIGKTERIILIDKLNSNYQNKYLKSSQITAIFQFALGLSYLLIKGPPEMTINIIDTYYSKNMLGNLIIVESALSYNLNIYNNYREYFSSSILAFPNYLLTQLFYLPTKTKIYYNKMKIENNKENENVED